MDELFAICSRHFTVYLHELMQQFVFLFGELLTADLIQHLSYNHLLAVTRRIHCTPARELVTTVLYVTLH